MRRVRETAPPKPGDPNPDLSSYLQEIDGRVRDADLPPFRRYDPDPTTDPSRPSVGAEHMPTQAPDPTDTIDELEERIFGRDLRPSGLDQEFPEW